MRLTVFVVLCVLFGFARSQSSCSQYCVSGADCCAKVEECLNYIAAIGASTPPLKTTVCSLFRVCPPNYDLIGNQCQKQDQTVHNTKGLTFTTPYTSLTDCFEKGGYGNYGDNFCLDPYREAHRQCLRSLDRRG